EPVELDPASWGAVPRARPCHTWLGRWQRVRISQSPSLLTASHLAARLTSTVGALGGDDTPTATIDVVDGLGSGTEPVVSDSLARSAVGCRCQALRVVAPTRGPNVSRAGAGPRGVGADDVGMNEMRPLSRGSGRLLVHVHAASWRAGGAAPSSRTGVAH